MASHPPHLLVYLCEETRWDECFGDSISLSIRECEQISSVHTLHDPINLQDLVCQSASHLLRYHTRILGVKYQVEETHYQSTVDE